MFGEVATRTAERPGGYTRIIKLGDVRLGDAAEMCMMELVDFNDLYKKDGAEKKGKTRRSRKGKKAEGAEEVTEGEAPAAEAKAKAGKKEKVVEKPKAKEKEKKPAPKKSRVVVVRDQGRTRATGIIKISSCTIATCNIG